MTSRILPPEEWPRLAGTEAETIWPLLSPETARVLVIEQDAEIVGCWLLYPLLHAECVWIAPAHRGRGAVARRLLALMRRVAQSLGWRTVITAACSDEVRRLLDHLGAVPIPGTHHAIPIGERSCPR